MPDPVTPAGKPPRSERGTRTILAVLLVSAGLLGLFEIVHVLFEPRGSRDGLHLARGALTVAVIAAIVLLLARRSRLRRERRRARARWHLEGLLRSSPQAIVTSDLRGRFTHVSESACTLLEREAVDLIGRPVAEIYARGRVEAIELLRALARDGEIRDRAVDLIRGDGVVVAVSLSVSLITDGEGRRVGILGLVRPDERSEDGRADREKLVEFAAIRELSSAIAHEVRNPLAGIRGAMQVFRSSGDRSPREDAVLGEVLEQIRRLEDMVRDLLAFAQPAPARPRPENVANLVARAVTVVRGAPWMAGVEVEVDVDPELAALADPEQILRALTIVLENAAHAVAGRGTVCVDAAREERTVAIGIRDSGPGIPEERFDDIFRPFFTTKHRGSGLGLAIARRILVAHGGTIRPDPPGDGGARFVLRLPAVPGRGGRDRD